METLDRCSGADGALRVEKSPEARIGLSLPLSPARITSQKQTFMLILDYRPIFRHSTCKDASWRGWYQLLSCLPADICLHTPSYAWQHSIPSERI